VSVDRPAFNVLSLCAGAGGLDLGVRLAVSAARTVCAVEIEAYACEVLATRMEEGHLDAAPIWTDLRTFDGRPWRGVVDCIIGGYPCQPFSVAGKMRGADDPRHLWPHVARIIREADPEFVFLENVSNHLNVGFDVVARELQAMGRRVAAGVFTAEEIGATHKRERLFVMAHSDRRQSPRRGGGSGDTAGRGTRTESSGPSAGLAHGHGRGLESLRGGGLLYGERSSRRDDVDGCGSAAVADPRRGERRQQDAGSAPRDESADGRRSEGNHVAEREGSQGRREPIVERADELPPWPPSPEDVRVWQAVLDRWPEVEPALRGMVDGMAPRVDRLRLCGNGVVPQQAAYAFVTLATDLGLL
jgi:DNA (cytosine-5)-methyltransferase 1